VPPGLQCTRTYALSFFDYPTCCFGQRLVSLDFLLSGRGSSRRAIADWAPRFAGGLQQSVGELLLLPPQSLEEPMHVIILFGAQLIADAPDFFDGAFWFHGIKLPSIRGVCKPPAA